MDAKEMRRFEEVLLLPDRGDFLARLIELHRDLIAAIQSAQAETHGKASGSLTITLGYELDRQGRMSMAADATVKPPKLPKARASCWTLPGGWLTPVDPDQLRMDLRDVTGERREIR